MAQRRLARLRLCAARSRRTRSRSTSRCPTINARETNAQMAGLTGRDLPTGVLPGRGEGRRTTRSTAAARRNLGQRLRSSSHLTCARPLCACAFTRNRSRSARRSSTSSTPRPSATEAPRRRRTAGQALPGSASTRPASARRRRTSRRWDGSPRRDSTQGRHGAPEADQADLVRGALVEHAHRLLPRRDERS